MQFLHITPSLEWMIGATAIANMFLATVHGLIADVQNERHSVQFLKFNSLNFLDIFKLMTLNCIFLQLHWKWQRKLPWLSLSVEMIFLLKGQCHEKLLRFLLKICFSLKVFLTFSQFNFFRELLQYFGIFYS